MPANPFQVLPAPTGYDNTNDPMSVPSTTAQALINLLCDRMGLARGMGQLIPVADISSIGPTNFGGDDLVEPRAYNMAYYYGSQTITYPGVTAIVSNPAGNRLIVEIAGELYALAYVGIGTNPSAQFYPPYPPVFEPPVMIVSAGYNFTLAPVNNVYPRMRSAQFQKELILVRGWFTYPNLRYYVGVNSVAPSPDPGVLYPLGIGTPPPLVAGAGSPPAVNFNVPTGSNVPKVGVIQYTYTLADEFMRQSSPPIAATLNFASSPTSDALITLSIVNPTSGPLNYYYYFIYATVEGGSLFYQIATGALTFGTNTISYEDGEPDAFVETGIVGPRYGQNDPPLPANQVVVFKNRVWLNNLASPNGIQASNLNSPTQFNSQGYLPTLGNVNDGVTLTIDNDYGDPAYTMVVFGSYLVFFKRNAIWMLYGQDASNFQPQPLQSFRGEASPDTATRCENVLVYLSTDGVYQFDGVNCVKLSKPIEASLLQYNLTPAGQIAYANAQAAFVARRYILNIGVDIYIFDLDAAQNGQSGWTTMLFGIDVASWMQLNYGYNIFTGILTEPQPTSNQGIAGSGIPMPPYVQPPLPPAEWPLPPTTVPPPVFLPPLFLAYSPGGGIDSVQTVHGTGLLTVSSITINGVSQQINSIVNDTELIFTVHSGSSGLLVATNPYGVTTVAPFVIAGFVDIFNRANSALPGTNGWVNNSGANSFNIVSDQCVCGTGGAANGCRNTGATYADGYAIGQFVFPATGTAVSLQYRAIGSSGSWTGYVATFEYVSGSDAFSVSLYSVTAGILSQIGSTINFVVSGFSVTQMVSCAVHFVAGAHTIYVNGATVHQFNDSTYTSAGEGGLYYPSASGSPICVGVAFGV